MTLASSRGLISSRHAHTSVNISTAPAELAPSWEIDTTAPLFLPQLSCAGSSNTPYPTISLTIAAEQP